MLLRKLHLIHRDTLEENIGKLTSMVSKLTAHIDDPVKQFKPKIYESKGRGQMRNICDRHNYGQRSYQNRYRTNSRDRRIEFSGRIHYGQNDRDIPRYDKNYRRDFGRGNFRGNIRLNQNYRGQKL